MGGCSLVACPSYTSRGLHSAVDAWRSNEYMCFLLSMTANSVKLRRVCVVSPDIPSGMSLLVTCAIAQVVCRLRSVRHNVPYPA